MSGAFEFGMLGLVIQCPNHVIIPHGIFLRAFKETTKKSKNAPQKLNVMTSILLIITAHV